MRLRGSITVFLALLLTCLFSGIFALLECARVSCIRANAQMSTRQAGDGLLSAYSRPLWENYHLLFWEGEASDFPELSRACACQQEVLLGNTAAGTVFGNNYDACDVGLCSVTVDGYQLATDDGGAAFRAQAARAMKQEVAQDALSGMLDLLTSTGGVKSEEEVAKSEESAVGALESLQNGKKKADAPAAGSADSGAAEVPVQKVSENPIQWMKNTKKKGIFAYLMPQEDISAKKLERSGTVSRRRLKMGTLSAAAKGGASEKLLFRLYLEKFFSNVSEDAADGALDYEVEYMIAGKSSDKANLRAVINRLLLLREGANLVFLETDAEKKNTAMTTALAITAAAGHPELADAIGQGILAAWAYAESLSDVRILLSGGKVSLIKTEEQWHTKLDDLSGSVKETEGEKQQRGLSYANYLQLLMWTMPDQKLSYRAMDLIEKNTAVRMDEMAAQLECSYGYEAPALFWNFVSLGGHSVSGFHFTDSARLSYLDGGK